MPSGVQIHGAFPALVAHEGCLGLGAAQEETLAALAGQDVVMDPVGSITAYQAQALIFGGLGTGFHLR